jgi:ABC-2 type transport system ATP-binding protein
MHDPEILILDEPTTGLDPNQIQEIRRVIRDLGQSKTVILSTHILQEVEALCDRVLILHEGRIAASGTTDQIGRELKGQRVYHLELAGLPSAAADSSAAGPAVSDLSETSRGELEKLGEVLTSDSGDSSPAKFRIAVRDDVSGRDLFDWAVAAEVKLESMSLERVSLEAIFARLTSGFEGEDAGGEE